MAKSEKMDVTELQSLLAAEKASALGTATASDLTRDRAKALDYYLGNMDDDMPSAEGRSSAVSSDVSDAVEGMLPQLMEIFASADEVVQFNPVGPEDVEAADQETQYVNHVFMQENPGFLVLYSMIKDALLSKTGIAKVWCEESEKEDRETYYDMPDEQFVMIQADPEVEIVEHTETPSMDVATGAPITVHDVVVVRRQTLKKVRTEPVPPEEFLISRKARSLRDATFCAHKVLKTQADLIEQGYDAEQVKQLPSKTYTENTEEIARNTIEGQQSRGDTQNDAGRLIEVVENYVKMDYEGDGVARKYKVTTAGTDGHVLLKGGEPDIEPVDEFPFAAITPIIMTHRFFGRSVADLVMDVQRIKTAMLRAILDNAYLTSNARYEVAESGASERTLDDLLANRPGGIVRTRTPGAVNPLQTMPLGPQFFGILEYVDAYKEQRTGVTKNGQGLDANALQNQSATAANLQYTAAMGRIKLIARVFAETGIRDLFLLLHATLQKHGDKQAVVRLRNKWTVVNPRDWKKRSDMTVSVALGSGGKNEQIQNLIMLLQFQKEAIMNPSLGLVKPENIFATGKKLIELMGHKNVEAFLTDPTGQPPAPPPPDPKLQELQMKAQLETQKMQMDAQLQQQIAERQANTETMQAQADIATEQKKAEFEMQMAQQKFEFEKELKLMDHQAKVAQMQLQAQQKQVPAASVEMKHNAEGVTAPIAEMIAGLAGHMNERHAQQTSMLVDALKQIHGPKHIVRDENGRVVGVAPANH